MYVCSPQQLYECVELVLRYLRYKYLHLMGCCLLKLCGTSSVCLLALIFKLNGTVFTSSRCLILLYGFFGTAPVEDRIIEKIFRPTWFFSVISFISSSASYFYCRLWFSTETSIRLDLSRFLMGYMACYDSFPYLVVIVIIIINTDHYILLGSEILIVCILYDHASLWGSPVRNRRHLVLQEMSLFFNKNDCHKPNSLESLV